MLRDEKFHWNPPLMISRPNRSEMFPWSWFFKKMLWFCHLSFFQASQILQWCNLSWTNSFVLCKFHVKCNLIVLSDNHVWALMNPKYFSRSKLLNKTHISLNENVFSFIKRVKHLAEFTDFLLLEVLAIYLYLKAYPKYCAQRWWLRNIINITK